MSKKGVVIAAGVGVAAWLLFRKKAVAAPAPPVVAGDVTSGAQSVTIDTNVLSPTFGLEIPVATEQ